MSMLMRVWITLTAVISVSLTAVPAATPAPRPAANPRSDFQTDHRLDSQITLGPELLTVGQLVTQLNRVQAKLRFSAEQGVEGESLAVWICDRPLLEALEAVAIAGRFDWQTTPQGYRLRATSRPITPRTARTPEPRLDADAALVTSVTWPPEFPPMRVQAKPGLLAAYHPKPFGAALAEIGSRSKVSLVAVTPVLQRAARFADQRMKIASARGCDVMERIAAMDGGHWTRLGATYVLSPLAEVVDLRRMPLAVRQSEIDVTAERLLRSLSAGQLRKLRTGGNVQLEQLSRTQRAQMARLAQLHHSVAPVYPWNVVTDPTGWNLTAERDNVIFGLLSGSRAPFLERTLKGLTSTADQP
jgi:hypothetical protein